LWSVGALVGAGGAGYYYYSQGNGSLLAGSSGETKGVFTPKFEDYQKVYNEIAERLEEKDDYDDGSYGKSEDFSILLVLEVVLQKTASGISEIYKRGVLTPRFRL
jgi:hypothetical protein